MEEKEGQELSSCLSDGLIAELGAHHGFSLSFNFLAEKRGRIIYVSLSRRPGVRGKGQK